MDILNNTRAESALKRDVLQLDCCAAVIAVQFDNGQIAVHNMGDPAGREEIYGALGTASCRKLSEYNARILLAPTEEGGEA